MKFITLAVILIAVTIADGSAQKNTPFKPKVVYRSDNLVITQISRNAFQHTSFLQTQDFGNVPCNGLVVSNSGEALVFDTPTSDKSAGELIRWLTNTLHYKVNAIIPTHFHDDCLGGLKAFQHHHIPSYAYYKTIELAKANNFAVPENSFNDSLVLKVGKTKVMARFFGEGHTRDNVVGYFPSENILFGGCLIKEIDATKGYLGDANVDAWSGTVEKVKQAFPDVQLVVPGHGDCGNQALLDYTIRLFKTKQ